MTSTQTKYNYHSADSYVYAERKFLLYVVALPCMYAHVWVGPLVTTAIVLIQQTLKSPLHVVVVV